MAWLRFTPLALVLTAACGDSSDDGDDSDAQTGTGTADDDDDDDATDPSDTSATDPSTTSATTVDDTGATDGDTTTPGTDDTGPGPGGSCVDVGDCVVVEDCCNCTVASASDPPTCDIVECEQSKCGEIGFTPEAQCELGSCEPVAVPCDPGVVTCDSVPPDCNDGFFPGVAPDASCWTGGCVPADACDVVPGCEDCPENEACVEYSTQLGPKFHCSPMPEACGGAPTCACLAEACVAPFDACSDGPGAVSCSCPVCG